MDNKVIALALTVALLAGFGGSYGLGYVIYQPQIQNLQNELEELHDDMGNVDNRLANLNSTLSDIQSSVIVLDVELDTTNSTLTSTQLAITSLQNQLVSVQSQLDSLNSRLDTLNSTVQSTVASLQNQLASIQNQLDSLNSRVLTLEYRNWHLVDFIQGSSNTTMGTFQLQGKEIRVMWEGSGYSPSSWLSIALRFPSGVLYSYYGSSGIWTVTNVEEELAQPGQYYLDITSYQTDYIISIWDYY